MAADWAIEAPAPMRRPRGAFLQSKNLRERNKLAQRGLATVRGIKEI